MRKRYNFSAAKKSPYAKRLKRLKGQRTLSEDAADVAVFEARARELVVAFEAVLKDLKRRSKL